MGDFEELYHLYYSYVYHYILKLTDYQDNIAEEVTQESFYQAYLSLKRFRGDCSIKSWLCQIAKNTYYNYMKTHSKESCMEDAILNKHDNMNLDTMTENKQLIIHIKEIISNLDERSRTVVIYRLFDEMPYKEIGKLTGIREATSKVIFSRAKVKIKQQLKEIYGYEI